MSEGLASPTYFPTNQLYSLYETWADGEIGVVVTGNVMVDKRALGEPRNVVVESDEVRPYLEKWAESGTKNNTQLWMQLNHPGKQVFKGVVSDSVAPSAIPFEGSLGRFFPPPRALNSLEIKEIIHRFGYSAKLAKISGFTGVQIHAAHGYLLSQFLSPTHNQREDEWGGSIDNRCRLLIEVFREIRTQTGSDFPISVKLNSTDFQKAGFSEDDSLYVAHRLHQEGVDLLELSGGTYESPVMTGVVKDSTREREAYFLEFAETLRKESSLPLAVTGGFRTKEGMMEAVLSGATDFIGMARPLAVYPDYPLKVLNGENQNIVISEKRTGIKTIDQSAMLEMTWYAQQLERLSKGKNPKPNFPVFLSLIKSLLKNGNEIFGSRRS